ncbi:glycosyltransferase family 4 protein [Hyphomicrobium sp.]|uniref:glycosyltransferase family 4 protein n=1 Tax=Hyphomicrobium sp. TaxID=82 RepID=UPI002FDF058D
MKIVYISNSIIPSRSANSIHVMKVCQAFADNGHEVDLFAPDFGSLQDRKPDPFPFYGVKQNFRVISLPATTGRIGTHLYEIHAAREARRISPNLIYSRSALASLFTDRRVPTIFECHAPINRNWITSRLVATLIRRKNLVRFVVITQTLRDHYLASYPQLESKILVAPDAADPPQENCTPAMLDSRSSSLNVGYVGHLYPGKGMEVVVPLAERYPRATFHVVGGTEGDLAAWRKTAAHLGNIVFYGHQPPAVAASYIAACDVALLPNQHTVRAFGVTGRTSGLDIGQWTSPLKMFEYMAHGKAIIASDLPVLKEILAHEDNALLARPDDIDAWLVNLKRLDDDPQLRTTLGENAKRDFLNNHTWRKRSALTIAGLP